MIRKIYSKPISLSWLFVSRTPKHHADHAVSTYKPYKVYKVRLQDIRTNRVSLDEIKDTPLDEPVKYAVNPVNENWNVGWDTFEEAQLALELNNSGIQEYTNYIKIQKLAEQKKLFKPNLANIFKTYCVSKKNKAKYRIKSKWFRFKSKIKNSIKAYFTVKTDQEILKEELSKITWSGGEK